MSFIRSLTSKRGTELELELGGVAMRLMSKLFSGFDLIPERMERALLMEASKSEAELPWLRAFSSAVGSVRGLLLRSANGEVDRFSTCARGEENWLVRLLSKLLLSQSRESSVGGFSDVDVEEEGGSKEVVTVGRAAYLDAVTLYLCTCCLCVELIVVRIA